MTYHLRRRNGFVVKAESNGGDNGNSVDKGENEVRGESTMPDRFRYLMKEGPDKPVRWPWFIDNGNSVDKGENEVRGESTIPDRFRYLTKEGPDKPIRWPWFIGRMYSFIQSACLDRICSTGVFLSLRTSMAFLLYAWRTVLWELGNWKKAVGALFRFLGYISKLALAVVYYFIGDQITTIIRFIESTIYSLRAFYSGLIAYAPIQELTTIIVLASCVLAIGEAAVPDSVNSQQYILTAAGITGYAAVRGYISELFFWFLLVGLFVFSRFMKKRDYVSSAMPAAAALAAVGEPWVRFVVMVSYAALAVVQHSKMPFNKSEGETTGAVRKVPFPLICAALAIGVRLAAKWAGYQHLTWMIV
ncbi:hypothetical protein RND71_035214 [Anisodus tanguticus]|uniref:Uncharacterized protein n=1 Tax=Anisodus tanguticus TaxID=243964 RepID=A0AAE1UUA4_9SOLA|nr:hypothetical protein RND71_035214 [Anisodus tanguticus]